MCPYPARGTSGFIWTELLCPTDRTSGSIWTEGHVKCVFYVVFKRGVCVSAGGQAGGG